MNYKHKNWKYIAECKDMELRHEYQIFTISNWSNEWTLSSTFIEDSTDWIEIKEDESPIEELSRKLNQAQNKAEIRTAIRAIGDYLKQNLPKDLLANPK